MAEEADPSAVSISAQIPRSLVVSALALFGTLGVGIGTQIAPAIDSRALAACFDNAETARGFAQEAIKMSQTALSVAGQHGDEFVSLSKRIDNNTDKVDALRIEIIQRTVSRYTAEDAAKERTDQARRDAEQDAHDANQDRRADSLERDVDALLDKVFGK